MSLYDQQQRRPESSRSATEAPGPATPGMPGVDARSPLLQRKIARRVQRKKEDDSGIVDPWAGESQSPAKPRAADEGHQSADEGEIVDPWGAPIAQRGKAALEKLKGKQTATPKWAQTGGDGGKAKDMKFFPPWFSELQGVLMNSRDWGEDEEAGQQALRDYADWLLTKSGKKLPGNVATFLQYIGRSQPNQKAAVKAGDKSVADLGGAVGNNNWCYASSNQAIILALQAKNLKPNKAVNAWAAQLIARGKAAKGKKMGGPVDEPKPEIAGIQAPAAYSAPLQPGDFVQYLYDRCQGGGHAVTIVEDLGDSFLQVSGNTGGMSGVAIEQKGRLTEPPKDFDLSSTMPKHEKLPENATAKERKEENDRAVAAARGAIAKYNFQGKVLIYSIQRLGDVFVELEKLDGVEPGTPEYQKVIKDLDLVEINPAPKKPTA